MKKLIIPGLMMIAGLFQSCTINETPAPITKEFLAEVFEVRADFTTNNEFRNFYTLDPVIFDSDVLLVYEFTGKDKNGADIWKPLPQIYTFNEGVMQYNFDFTRTDFSIFMDANFDRLRLNSSWRLNKRFRIVIVPGKFSNNLDKDNLLNVMKELNLTEQSVQPLSH